MKSYYFGCYKQVGHYFFDETMNKIAYRDIEKYVPWLNPINVDGGLVPKSYFEQGDALLYNKDGWTALCFHDYTVDDRPGSNSGFYAEGNWTFQEMLELFAKAFPEIFKRVGEIRLVKE